MINPELAADLQLCARRRLLPKRYKKKRALPLRILIVFGKAVLYFHVCFFGFVVLCSFVFKFANPAVSGIMVYRWLQGTGVHETHFIPLKKIPADTKNAFIHLEDLYFYYHGGISLGAVREAWQENQDAGRIVRGASTISMQAARTLFLNPERSWLRKYLEAGSTLIIEQILGKDRILELYLNNIEFGPGVFGLGAAAEYHYGTSFAKLDWLQRMKLAVIIASPLLYNVKTFWKSPALASRANLLGLGGAATKANKESETEKVKNAESAKKSEEKQSAETPTDGAKPVQADELPAIPEAPADPTTESEAAPALP